MYHNLDFVHVLLLQMDAIKSGRAYDIRTHIPHVRHFIFDLSDSNTKFGEIEAISTPIGHQFHKFVLKTAKFESKTPDLRNVGYTNDWK